MKKFNFSKGLVIGLLTLALCLTCFAAAKVSADEDAAKKLQVTFTVTYKESLTAEGVDYTYVAEDQEAKAVIDLDTVLAEMTTGEEGNEAVLDEDVVMAQTGSTVTAPVITGTGLTYANKKFTVANTLADDGEVAVSFTVIKALSGIKYDPETDSVVVETPYAGAKVYYADVKKSSGADLKGDKLASVTTKLTDGHNIAVIKLDDKTAGVKLANNKAAYLYISAKTPSDKKAKYAPNVTIDPTECKKAVITVDYTVAGYEEDIAISRVELTGANAKTPTVYARPVAPAGLGEDATEEEIAAQEEAMEAYNAAIDEFEAILDRLLYSEDGTTWKAVTASHANGGFTGKKLASYLGEGKKLTFKLLGTEAQPAVEAQEAVEGQEAVPDDPDTPEDESQPAVPARPAVEAQEAKNATRTSKAIKVAVKKQAAKKDVKVDVNITAIGLKNGYDFAIRTTKLGTGEIIGKNEWITILPVNKAGTAESEFIATVEYTPVAKVTANAAMFTKTKFKALGLDKAIEVANNIYESEYSRAEKIYIYYRKSATAKAPAQEAALMEIAAQAAAPTPKLTSGYAAVADPTKNTFELSFNGSGSLEYIVIGASDFEAITKAEDPDSIDWVNSKWTKVGKITVGKSKSKYKLASSTGKAQAHTLAAGDYIFVRVAGDKSTPTFASDYKILKVEADKASVKLTGEEQAAERYVVSVYTPEENAGGETEEVKHTLGIAIVGEGPDGLKKFWKTEDGEWTEYTESITNLPAGTYYVKLAESAEGDANTAFTKVDASGAEIMSAWIVEGVVKMVLPENESVERCINFHFE